ncbi:hypothetical protein [Peptoniphilus catoniae]|uniref:hypothetical protein n=1 Tax=Peptoniphilus catoniae TaxID=1660341 RepID=UPI0010FDEBE9|nr:hypothetical protein [Peptoniphilus catoniae]
MKAQKVFRLWVAAIILLLLPTRVYADMGPKPSLNIKIKNFEEGYKLYPSSKEYKDYTLINRNEDLSQEFVDRYKILNGIDKGIPIQSYYKEEGGYLLHTYSYRVPPTIRYICLEADGSVRESNYFQIKVFNENLALDLETMTLKRSVPLAVDYLLQFLKTFLPTLALEFALLYFFGYRGRHNFKVFLLINLITQGILHITCSYVCFKYGFLSAGLTMVPIEIFIIIVEGVYLGKNLQGKTTLRNVVYAISANILSFLLGISLYTI